MEVRITARDVFAVVLAGTLVDEVQAGSSKCGAAGARTINVWYPGETVDLRMVDKNVCSNGQYDLTVTDWRERRVLTHAYNPKDGGRVAFSESEVGSFGAFRVVSTSRGCRLTSGSTRWKSAASEWW